MPRDHDAYRAEAQHRYSMPKTSPPTPLHSPDVIITRSGLSIPKGSVGKPARAEKPTPRRKKERTKAAQRVDKLLKPLSQLAKEHPSVPVADIGAYVHRSAAERRREVEQCKVPGKIKRPMNAFMLYRKAYQNLAKSLCTQNNHQVVSQVCGGGWPMEPEHVREQFNEWAKIERANHQTAHPGYKFTPAKPKRKRSDDADASDPEGGDYDGCHEGSRSRSRPKVARRGPATASPSPATYQQPYSSHLHSYPRGLPMLGFDIHDHALYSGKALVMPFDRSGFVDSHYCQQSVQQHNGPSGLIEDVYVRKTANPAPAAGYGAGPVDSELSLLGPYAGMSSIGMVESAIDPSLVSYEASPSEAAFGDMGFENQQKWYPQLGFRELARDAPDSGTHFDDALDPGLKYLQGEENDWHIQEIDSLDNCMANGGHSLGRRES
jgi:HMG (high mobility group) box